MNWTYLFLAVLSVPVFAQPRPRAADIGPKAGTLPSGPLGAITGVAGVRVGHATLIRGDSIRTGVTVIMPPGAVYIGNAFGKLAGSAQVEELGEIETPIALTSTLRRSPRG